MFPKMLNIKKQLSDDDAVRILNHGEYGVLATISSTGYPYALPLSYVYLNNALYFHCATKGHKLENITNNPKVSFTITTNTQVLPEKFTTLYQSIVVFGEAFLVKEAAEKKAVLMELIQKYSPEFIKEGIDYMNDAIDHTKVVRIEIGHLTAKGRKK